jgi:hypothetical protein
MATGIFIAHRRGQGPSGCAALGRGGWAWIFQRLRAAQQQVALPWLDGLLDRLAVVGRRLAQHVVDDLGRTPGWPMPRRSRQ